MKRSFSITIKDGLIDSVGGAKIASYIRQRKDGPATITVATGVDAGDSKRSSRQNRYYWGVVIDTYLYAMIEVGDNTVEDVRKRLRKATLSDALHEMLKYEFAGVEVVDINSGEVRRLPMGTSEMNTKEIGIYWDKIRDACQDRYGVYIPPPPDDVFEDEP